MPEPYNFQRVTHPLPGHLYRVSRPGRSLGSEVQVPGTAVREWIDGVAATLDEDGYGTEIAYVCLLGRKRDGRREIADFYDARGPNDGDDRPTLAKPVWQEYLNRLAAGRLLFSVEHYPSVDQVDLPARLVDEVAARLRTLLLGGRTVLVGCSSAVGRTGQILHRFATATPPP